MNLFSCNCAHRARCQTAIHAGSQHPFTARQTQIFRQGDGDLSALSRSKINSQKYSTAVVPVHVQWYYTYRYWYYEYTYFYWYLQGTYYSSRYLGTYMYAGTIIVRYEYYYYYIYYNYNYV